MDFSFFYTLIDPPAIKWIWLTPAGVLFVFAYLMSIRGLGIKKGTIDATKRLYQMFVVDRWSLNGINITLTGVILSFVCRVLTPWPLLIKVLFLVSVWLFHIGILMTLGEVAVKSVLKWRRTKSLHGQT